MRNNQLNNENDIELRRKRGGRMRRASSGAGISENSRIRMRALSGEVHSGHSATEEESEHGGSSSSPSQGGSHRGSQVDDAALLMTAFKCPKTKKVKQSPYFYALWCWFYIHGWI